MFLVLDNDPKGLGQEELFNSVKKIEFVMPLPHPQETPNGELISEINLQHQSAI